MFTNEEYEAVMLVYFEQFLGFLKDIPESLWVGLVTSLTAICTVVLSNRNHEKRLKEQFKHESEEAKNNRISNLRQQSYQVVAQAIHKTNLDLGACLSSKNISNEISRSIQPLLSSIAQANLIAESGTASKLAALTEFYTILSLDLLKLAAPLQTIHNNIDLCSKYYDKTQEELNSTLAAMNNYNINNTAKSSINFSALQSQYKFLQERASEHSEETMKNMTDSLEEIKKLANYIIPKMIEAEEIIIDAMVAMREEVGISTDTKPLREQLIASHHKYINKLQEIMN